MIMRIIVTVTIWSYDQLAILTTFVCPKDGLIGGTSLHLYIILQSIIPY